MAINQAGRGCHTVDATDLIDVEDFLRPREVDRGLFSDPTRAVSQRAQRSGLVDPQP